MGIDVWTCAGRLLPFSCPNPKKHLQYKSKASHLFKLHCQTTVKSYRSKAFDVVPMWHTHSRTNQSWKKNVSAALDYTLFRIYYYSAFVCIYVYLNACITCRYYLCKSGKSLFSPYCRHLTQFLRLTGLKLCRKPSTTLTKISKKRKNSSGK